MFGKTFRGLKRPLYDIASLAGGRGGFAALAGKVLSALMCAAFCLVIFIARADAAPNDDTPLLGVYEGWAWPVVVIPPPEGWESPEGESIKYGMRLAEREISLLREGIRGREVTFMFSSVGGPSELTNRLNVWRTMKTFAIVSFAGAGMNEELKKLCAASGPSVIFSGGEDLAIKNVATGKPYPYLFALDFTYFARANALAEFAAAEAPPASVAVITDRLSVKLAKGAEENAALLRKRKVDVFPIYVPGMAIYQFSAQVQEAESGGAGVIVSWLDSLATLSIWRTVSLIGGAVHVYYPGARHDLLLDAEGLTLVDKDAPLDIDEEGKRVIIVKGRDIFDKELSDPVTAGKAYALGRWVIEGFKGALSTDIPSLAHSFANAADIPLMGERLSIDPRTNRPAARKYGILRVEGRKFAPVASVDVYSVEVTE
jgi:hypothetical protein